MKLILAVSLLLVLSSCSHEAPSLVSQTKLLFQIQDRNIAKDEITEYRFYEDGLINKSITHSTSNQANLLKSNFYKLKQEQIATVKEFQTKLQDLDYHNYFPWKEDIYDRGNVVRIEFPDKVEIKYKDAKSSDEILSMQTFYYYTGHKESPELFKSLVEFIGRL